MADNLELLAAYYEEGWAFVRDGAHVSLLRPPYRNASLQEVTLSVVDQAIHKHNFQQVGQTFATWAALVDFLRSRILDELQQQGQALPTPEQLRQLVHFAPPNIIDRYLRRAESD